MHLKLVLCTHLRVSPFHKQLHVEHELSNDLLWLATGTRRFRCLATVAPIRPHPAVEEEGQRLGEQLALIYEVKLNGLEEMLQPLLRRNTTDN